MCNDKEPEKVLALLPRGARYYFTQANVRRATPASELYEIGLRLGLNCHNYQAHNPERMQFHVRQHKGGTVICYDGKVEKVDMKYPGGISAGVYPAWHPTLPLIVYSTNRTGQTFHTFDTQKIEVQDTYSDLILYDVEKQEVQPLPRDTNDLDCFPFWSPDGKAFSLRKRHGEPLEWRCY